MSARDLANCRLKLEAAAWDFEDDDSFDASTGSHWYPGRTVPLVPNILIRHLSEPGDTILDLFCGSGTTLVEAVRLGRNAIGVDNNPIAALMSQAKVAEIDDTVFGAYSDGLLRRAHALAARYRDGSESPPIPHLSENQAWYQADTLLDLAAIWTTISNDPGPNQLVAKAAFSSVLRKASSQAESFGKLPRGQHGTIEPWELIRENSTPVTLVRREALPLFALNLSRFQNAARELEQSRHAIGDSGKRSWARVIVGPSHLMLREIPSASVDLVVTSPPYFGFFDYAVSQRLSFLWMGYDLAHVTRMELGPRAERKQLGALEDFLLGLQNSFREASRVLKPGCHCCILIGEAPYCQAHIDEFAERLVNIGLTLMEVLPRPLAEGASLRTEKIFILKRGSYVSIHDRY